MSDKIILNPYIYELNSESSNIFMTLKTVFCTTNCNLNGAIFTEDFIDGIVENQEKYIGIALVVDRSRLEAEQYDKLTHMYKDGNLGTDMIGSFVSFEKISNTDGSHSLIGEARVQKRYPKTCEAIQELYSTNSLLFSCEASVSKYGILTATTREVPYANGANFLMGNCIVTHPAEVEAKPTLLVASLDDDLLVENSTLDNNDINLKGGQLMTKKLEINEDTEVVDENLENSEFPPKKDGEEEKPEDKKEEVAEFPKKDDEAKEEDKEEEVAEMPKDEKCELLESEIASLKAELETVKAELSTKNEVIQVSETESAEKIIGLGLIVEELKLQVNSLLPIKEERDAILAEKAVQKQLADISDLKQYALNSKRVTEAELTDDVEIAEAIASLDKGKIALIISQRVVDSELANVKDVKSDSVITLASVTDNLLPEDTRKKWYQTQV